MLIIQNAWTQEALYLLKHQPLELQNWEECFQLDTFPVQMADFSK